MPHTPAQPQTALQGIKVLDLSRVLAGPWCTMTLADLGADVIKVESLDGDDTRSWGEVIEGDISTYFAFLNRNKKSISMDLRAAETQPLLRKMLAWADVVVHNYRNGTDKTLGVDYATVQAINPGAVYCSISGYGRTGPYADRAGYDFVIQAEGGLMSVTGAPQGVPHKVGVPIVDIMTGQNAVQAILAALLARQHTGRGQFIDMALYDSQLQMLANVAGSALFTGEEPVRWGNAHPNIVPYQAFVGQDGRYFVLGVGSQKLWGALCKVLQKEEWHHDPRFMTNPDRVQHREVLVAQLAAIFATRPAAEWVALLTDAGIPAGSLQTVQEALGHPQTAAREMTLTLGQAPMVASPLKLQDTPVVYHSAPPHLGQHSLEVAAGFGEDAPALEKQGGIKQAPLPLLPVAQAGGEGR